MKQRKDREAVEIAVHDPLTDGRIGGIFADTENHKNGADERYLPCRVELRPVREIELVDHDFGDLSGAYYLDLTLDGELVEIARRRSPIVLTARQRRFTFFDQDTGVRRVKRVDIAEADPSCDCGPDRQQRDQPCAAP